MTPEEKDLLLQGLCTMFPYGVKCNVGDDKPYTLSRIEIDDKNGCLLDFKEKKDGLDMQVYLSEVKPYFFPLSSMSEEQRKELFYLSGIDIIYGIPFVVVSRCQIITRGKNESYTNFIEHCGNEKIVRYVKMADLLHNMDLTRLNEITDKDLQRIKKYHNSYKYLETL